MEANTGNEQESSRLLLFAYGTLKRGFENHEHYCRGTTSIEPAATWGRLHAFSPTIPTLVIPDALVLAHGTTKFEADLQLQHELEPQDCRPDWEAAAASGDWRLVRGELIEFPNALQRLAILDALEGFHPRIPGYYERVLIPIAPGGESQGPLTLAWTYVAPLDETPAGPPLGVDEWDPAAHR